MKAFRLVILIALTAALSAMPVFSPASAAGRPALSLFSTLTTKATLGLTVKCGLPTVWVTCDAPALRGVPDWRRLPSQQNQDQVESCCKPATAPTGPMFYRYRRSAQEFARITVAACLQTCPSFFADHRLRGNRAQETMFIRGWQRKSIGRTLCLALRRIQSQQRLCHHRLHGDRLPFVEPSRSSSRRLGSRIITFSPDVTITNSWSNGVVPTVPSS